MTRLGDDFPRMDARAKASGLALYTDDLTPRHALHGVVVRSPHAAARIMSIDTSAAVSAPGVAAVLTAEDVPTSLQGHYVQDEPLLARDRVRYVGEPVVLLAADTRHNAQVAAQLVRVDYTPEPAVTDIVAATREGASSVQGSEPNGVESSRILRGPVEDLFRGATLVVSTTIESHRVHQGYLEPRAAFASWDGERLSVTTTTQAPFEVRSSLGRLLDLPLSRVSVRVPTLGGGFGGKLHLGMAAFASVLAMATGSTVSVRCSREDEFQTPAPRENSRIVLHSAVSDTGEILARRAEIVLDSGAYSYDTPPIASVAALQACGPYRVSAVEVRSVSVLTNTVPTGSFRGPSGPQMSYAVEAHMNDIAERLGVNPLALRERLALREGDVGPTGQVMNDPAAVEVLARGKAFVEAWRADAPPPVRGRLRGWGLGCAMWTVSPVGGAVTLTLNEDGSATVLTGAVEIGTGAVSETLAVMVADELGIDPSSVQIAAGNTDGGPYDHGSQGSRTLYGVGTALADANRQVRDILLRQYALDHEADPADCELVDGFARVRGAPGSEQPLEAVIASAMGTGGPVAANGRFQPTAVPYDAGCVTGWVGAFNEPTFHCHAVEIEVDVATGRIDVARYAAIHDSGPVLNPHGARGQVVGGVVQGLGYALSEFLDADADGVVLNANLHDYRMPTIRDVPESIDVVFVSDHAGAEGYRGLKGVGEAPAIPCAAAVGSALRDAIGVQPARCRMDPETVLRLLAGSEQDEIDGVAS